LLEQSRNKTRSWNQHGSRPAVLAVRRERQVLGSGQEGVEELVGTRWWANGRRRRRPGEAWGVLVACMSAGEVVS